MNAFHALLNSISELGHSLVDLLAALFSVLAPWTPLAAWVVYWMFAVNWSKVRETIAKGGWVALLLIGAVMVLVWGSVSPGTGTFDFFGLHVSNFVEKTVYVSGLFIIMFLAGAVQLSGCCATWMPFDEPMLIAEASSHSHAAGGAHGATGDHGHGGHH
jgi:hypothetical protein